MASEEISAEAWLASGIEAYGKRSFTEAAEHFERAVALSPNSKDAHLALGAARSTLYQRRFSPVINYVSWEREISEHELKAYGEAK
ncbi:MAG: hypothetical protein JO217_12750 [Acidobacteriaceae bacterium]|nr:hypothetical protein [Acidobacteriaceae bacterium]